MKLIKVIKNETYKGNNGKTYHYQNYYIELDNGKKIAIKPAFAKDYQALELISETLDYRK